MVNTLACNAIGYGFAFPFRQYFRDLSLELVSRLKHRGAGRKIIYVAFQELLVTCSVSDDLLCNLDGLQCYGSLY